VTEKTGGPGRPLRKDAAENRQRLLLAAGQVFDRQGLEAGVEDVAKAAGVGMGTLYRRFPNKEALIAELVRAMLDGIAQDAREAVGSADGLGLETFLRAASARQAAHKGCLPRLWIESLAAELHQEIRDLIAELLADAQREGRVRAEITPADVYVILWSIRGLIAGARGIAPDAWGRHLEIVLQGLRPCAAR
jgi:AcrR family transcriptional regulator